MRTERVEGMTLEELSALGIGGRIVGSGSVLVTGVQHDSRRAEQGDLFVAISGAQHDGSRFIRDAMDHGAVAVMTETRVEHDVPQLIVESARRSLPIAAEAVYGSPTSSLRTVGITGTNGKTTTAYLVKSAIEGCDEKVALVGTTGVVIGDTELPSLHTTPEGDDISRFGRDALREGATHLVLEVSSHGLDLRRVDALDFDVAAFTNLSRDHLDYHGTLEAYGEAKARLFTELGPRYSVIHIDDRFGAALAERVPGDVIRCSRRADVAAEVRMTSWTTTRDGIEATIETPSGAVYVRSPLLGEHNLENLLVALGCVHALGLDVRRAAAALMTAGGSPGRLERVAHPGDVAVLVDYAHTPDALSRVLATMRQVTPGRLIAVFGAGGDRDRGKRPEMGRAGVEHADLCILTSDNPRTEDPTAILSEVEAGAKAAGAPALAQSDLVEARRGYCPIVDRTSAIRAAIVAAQSGDTVLLAGKGHETYQVIGTERTHFDDREVARAAIADLGGSN
jgi:UDP-N-acetylmuramoyl-L-alanyl-D-glutamate--2,6-diaminopimelate ligase